MAQEVRLNQGELRALMIAMGQVHLAGDEEALPDIHVDPDLVVRGRQAVDLEDATAAWMGRGGLVVLFALAGLVMGLSLAGFALWSHANELES